MLKKILMITCLAILIIVPIINISALTENVVVYSMKFDIYDIELVNPVEVTEQDITTWETQNNVQIPQQDEYGNTIDRETYYIKRFYPEFIFAYDDPDNQDNDSLLRDFPDRIEQYGFTELTSTYVIDKSKNQISKKTSNDNLILIASYKPDMDGSPVLFTIDHRTDFGRTDRLEYFNTIVPLTVAEKQIYYDHLKISYDDYQNKVQERYYNSDRLILSNFFEWQNNDRERLQKRILYENERPVINILFEYDNGNIIKEIWKNSAREVIRNYYYEYSNSQRIITNVEKFKNNELNQILLYDPNLQDERKPIEIRYFEDNIENKITYYEYDETTGSLIRQSSRIRNPFLQRVNGNTPNQWIIDGLYLEKSPQGQLIVEGHYSYGNKESKWTYYYEDTGTIKKVVNYNNGEREGESLFYYKQNLAVKAAISFYRDKRHGLWYYYREDGSLSEIKNYRLGLRHGVTQYFDENNNVIRTILYQNGNLISSN